MQQLTLWKETKPKRIQLKNKRPPTQTSDYSITGENDCQIIGHTLRAWDLSGCTVCPDCGVSIYCPGCITAHPQDTNAIPLYCNRHEESQVSA